jgi:cytochrome oxidase assembly protein ShyY1
MPRFRYLPLAERLEQRRKACMDFLAAFLLAMSIFLPFCLFYLGVWQ